MSPSYPFLSPLPLVTSNGPPPLFSLSFPCVVFFWGVISRVMGREGVKNNEEEKSLVGRKVLSCGHEITENEDNHRQAFVASCFRRLATGTMRLTNVSFRSSPSK